MNQNDSTTIYHSIFTKIGKFADDVLSDGMLITFKEGAPSDLSDYCFIHSHGVLLSELAVGQTILLGKNQYIITAVGDVATKNFKELGHLTFRFDGNNKAELPGTVHVVGEKLNQLIVGDEIIVIN